MFGIGFLCLGASAGLLTGFLTYRTRGVATNNGVSVVVLLPVLTSGAAVFLIPQLVTAPMSGFYPIGLLLSFMALQAGPLITACEGKSTYFKTISWCYGGTTALLACFAIYAAWKPIALCIS